MQHCTALHSQQTTALVPSNAVLVAFCSYTKAALHPIWANCIEECTGIQVFLENLCFLAELAVGVVNRDELGVSVVCQPDPFMGLSLPGLAGMPLHLVFACTFANKVESDVYQLHLSVLRMGAYGLISWSTYA